MAPILTTIVTSTANTVTEKFALLGVYGPYLVLPFSIMCMAAFNGSEDGIVTKAKST